MFCTTVVGLLFLRLDAYLRDARSHKPNHQSTASSPLLEPTPKNVPRESESIVSLLAGHTGLSSGRERIRDRGGMKELPSVCHGLEYGRNREWYRECRCGFFVIAGTCDECAVMEHLLSFLK